MRAENKVQRDLFLKKANMFIICIRQTIFAPKLCISL